MTRATAEMRKIAKELVVFETSQHKLSESVGINNFHVTDKLQPHLANMMGSGGFRALLLRSLVLARSEVSWLGAVRVEADGTLGGEEKLHAQLDAADLLEGRVVLVAQLLGLLETFIGLNLTLRVVSEVWPGSSVRNGNFVGSGGKNEKAK